jgi:hypothetical protein
MSSCRHNQGQLHLNFHFFLNANLIIAKTRFIQKKIEKRGVFQLFVGTAQH